VRDVGFFLFAAGWIVVVFANSGVITGSPMSILGADRLMAGLLAKSRERTGHASGGRGEGREEGTVSV